MIFIWLASLNPSSACGPFFPNSLLDGGDNALLVAPVASFHAELAAMKLAPPRHRAKLPDNSHAQQTADADLLDLRSALNQAKVPTHRKEEILRHHQLRRQIVLDYAQAAEAWREHPFDWNTGTSNTPPAFIAPEVAEGLPGEFAAYFRAAVAWHQGDRTNAIARWRALLELPAKERPFKSTWAAFMLGKALAESEPDRALNYFQQVRQLAAQKFTDTLGLAASSLGWEARVCLRQRRYTRAIDLYLEQLAAGDNSAAESLATTAAAALRQEVAYLKVLAAYPQSRRVVTAYVISHNWSPAGVTDDNGNTVADESPKTRWLAAVESAGVTDLEAAERLALAAYQAGQFDAAQRWIQLAKTSPVAQWLQAKLLLREGNVNGAANVLAKLARLWPVNAPLPVTTNSTLAGNLSLERDAAPGVTPAQQVLGELGTLRLSRREYTEALDALLRADFWTDAAWVAERVLTPDELKDYVDGHWPAQPEPKVETPDEPNNDEVEHPAKRDARACARLRHLLARRLTRLDRGLEARDYYPDALKPAYERLINGLLVAQTETFSAEQRAAGSWQAALAARREGMELLGTELEPDYALHGGNYEQGVGYADRLNTATNLVRASADELQRATAFPADPGHRFHYRYLAARLGWDAAKFLPNNSDQTAYILCTAGSWLKGRDPGAADLFYKSLVRRCRKTAIGDDADRRRWFPELDDEGKIIGPFTGPPRRLREEPSVDPPAAESEPDLSMTPEMAEPMENPGDQSEPEIEEAPDDATGEQNRVGGRGS